MNKLPERLDLLQGTLDLLILRTLKSRTSHGQAIAKHIQQTLHRLEAKGWISASWEISEKGKRARYYRLTALGRKQLGSEQSKWHAFSRAIGLILNSDVEEAQ